MEWDSVIACTGNRFLGSPTWFFLQDEKSYSCMAVFGTAILNLDVPWRGYQSHGLNFGSRS